MNSFNSTSSLRHIAFPSKIDFSNTTPVAKNSGLQAIDFLNDPKYEFKIFNDEFKDTPLLGVSTFFGVPNIKNTYTYPGPDRGADKGVLLVSRDMKYRFVERGFDKLWNIVEVKTPDLSLQGEIISSFTPGEKVNHYKARILWEICESDLNPTATTEYLLYRDNTLRAKISIGTAETLPKVDDGNIKLNETTTAYPVNAIIYNEEGSEDTAAMDKFYGDFIYETEANEETGVTSFKMIYVNQQKKMYFHPQSSHRLGLNEDVVAKSWFLFIDEFDSPELDGLNVPSSYSYTLKLKGYQYAQPCNNPGYKSAAEIAAENESETGDGTGDGTGDDGGR